MSSYLIGDVQGCFDSLQALLKKVKFSSDKDRLFFLGDVVNRGSKSLETLSFIKDLGDNAQMVLGNHDFHLLACALGGKKPNKKDTFTDVINANNADSLLDFLKNQPLAITHKGVLMVHAGIPPNWDVDRVIQQSKKVQKHLKKVNISQFLDDMYDNKPNIWSQDLSELAQCRYSINALMRLRFCKPNGALEFDCKMNYTHPPKGFKAWFMHKNRLLKNTDIFFGHWSSLSSVNQAHIYPMDHGCVWGRKLSAIRLKGRKIFSVSC
ncbi:Bis(5'-nucleosyl)-tetraphosphatase, symmetrical (EC 3.6.1.41) [uncultured Gammaproteobacteria bacterium]|uniref:symmetrical bis(5'-nucleosyl)-tetraphosphatase n=1 Tax=Bathymodiolus heckerae thiotrophic gill symbiont TaxID=1052212 RepID=UPI0010B3E6B3|nr:symmetrical bis(5'-nucleosyl)-tetraphosphatase [Bathymodiolus heckerae thiotrophic gill symbiont]CAC9433528.1 Bis(5'-nucleosyl)-tetraphosphatase, symmetrical (EC 3.6.1.41) [uncultured Gammaproteobacteria bacterium]SMN13088.1 Bis(5'-nucleosyl)-tetraphosphatase, symmetrical [Bathymodiolus heckerae thiotrophic gill symbiont]SMN14622.1 Bis(5'-nucleosyl)-tetraphosphatase, symmetrical [uncultured Candidatus Thioglobus sp.]